MEVYLAVVNSPLKEKTYPTIINESLPERSIDACRGRVRILKSGGLLVKENGRWVTSPQWEAYLSL